MKTISIKTKINKLIRKVGSRSTVAKLYGVTERQVRYWENGQRKMSNAEVFYLDRLLECDEYHV